MLGSKTMTFGPRFSGPAGGGAAADTPIPKRETVRATVTPANRRSGDMTPPTPSIVVVLRAAGARHQLAQAHRILGDPARGAYGWMTARRFHGGGGNRTRARFPRLALGVREGSPKPNVIAPTGVPPKRQRTSRYGLTLTDAKNRCHDASALQNHGGSGQLDKDA